LLGVGARLLQFADAWKEPNADRTYIFVASEHFTTHAHELLADYVRKRISPRRRRQLRLSCWKHAADRPAHKETFPERDNAVQLAWPGWIRDMDVDYQGVPHTLDPWRASQDRYGHQPGHPSSHPFLV